ncbi:MAG: GTP-binding protein, partial [Clostridia bacterium]|nr:GTP-binding protein [Clostridia bacterium]
MATTSKIRNVALIGHAGEGKTTLTEAILFNLKAIDRQGKVDDGNTVSDFDPEEIARKTSISLSVAYGDYNGVKFNILDVPGFFDFEGEMVQALSVADGAVVVTDASGALTVGTELALDYCLKNDIPTMIFISGLDKENIRFHDTVDAIHQKYGSKVAPMIVPFLENDRFKGWADVSTGKFFDENGKEQSAIPASIEGDYENSKAELTEVAAGNDEELMEKYFDAGELTTEEIEKGVKIGVKTCSCIPVLGGTALLNKGVKNLMDKIVALLPSPDEAKPAVMKKGDSAVKVAADPNGKVIIRVFKTIVDPFVGKLNIFKVVSGTLSAGMTLKNVSKEGDEKISSLYYIKGKKQDNASSIVAGDIGAV